MEIAPYFIENFDHILFTIEVSFVIMPYLGEKLKGNIENLHLKKKINLFQNFFFKIFQKFFRFKSLFGLIYSEKNFQKNLERNFDPKNI